MLILARKKGQRIVLGDGEILIDVFMLSNDTVRLGITAPKEIAIHRDEVYQAIKNGGRSVPALCAVEQSEASSAKAG